MKRPVIDVVAPRKISSGPPRTPVSNSTINLKTNTTQYRSQSPAPKQKIASPQPRRISASRISFLVFCACIGLVGAVFVGRAVSQMSSSSGQKVSQSGISVPTAQSSPLVTDRVTSRLMFVGDIFWGRAIERAANASGQGPAYIYSGLKIEDKSGYDMWVGDMECPVTDRNISYQTQVDSLLFNCRPEYLSETSKWFDVLSLANNHTDNNGGDWGLEQSRLHIANAGIQHFGTYSLDDPDEVCEIISAKAKSLVKAEVRIPVAICGYNLVVNVQPTDELMQNMKRLSSYMPVIAMPHMGVEYRATAEPEKQNAYRAMIDNGADVVIGAHPHVVQNSEVYKGRLIVYSTGNFLFDQQILGADTTQGLGVGIELAINDQEAINTYTNIGAECVAYKDSCLDMISEKIATRPSIEVAYSFEYFDQSTGVPTRASENTRAIIKAKAGVDGLTGLDTVWGGYRW